MEQIFRERVFSVPNLLTLMRIALLPVIVWAYQMGSALTALGVYLAAMATDALDGFIARRTNQITTIGQLLDPLADKLTLLTVLMLLYGAGELPGWVLLVLMAKEAALMAGSAFALKCGVVVRALPVGKVCTAVFVVFVVLKLAGFSAPAQGAMLLCVALSAMALIVYARNLILLIEEKAIRQRATW